MSAIDKVIEQTFAFARYLSWADLLNSLFEAEMSAEPTPGDPDAVRKHEWRWFGLMCYWYASLHVVIEAWDELHFSDPVIDRLLAHPTDSRTLLRRYRHGVFHFQGSVMDARITNLLQHGPAHVCWVRALHDELVRFFAQHLSRLVATDQQHSELRNGLEAIIHWYPSAEPPQIESLERTLSHGREVLGRYPDDRSTERQELERAFDSAVATLRQGRHNWALLRAQILREAGVE
jgi:hypothetical protein